MLKFLQKPSKTAKNPAQNVKGIAIQAILMKKNGDLGYEETKFRGTRQGNPPDG